MFDVACKIILNFSVQIKSWRATQVPTRHIVQRTIDYLTINFVGK